jgi:hypothetical protein
MLQILKQRFRQIGTAWQELLGKLKTRSKTMEKMVYDVHYLTDEPIDHVKSWLSSHCEGKWNLELDGMNEDYSKVNIRVKFECESDIVKLCELSSQAHYQH